MILFSNFGPENPPLFLLLCKPPLSLFSNLFLPSLFFFLLQVCFSKVLPPLVSLSFLFLQLACLPLLFPFFFSPKKTVGLSLSVSLTFSLKKSFQLSPPILLHSLCIYRQRERGPPCPILPLCRAWHGGIGVATPQPPLPL